MQRRDGTPPRHIASRFFASADDEGAIVVASIQGQNESRGVI
jgi:hypothetical protein